MGKWQFLEYRPSSDDKVFRVALRLLVKLSEASQTLPTGLFIKGVSRLDEEARFLGGFADIYRASYQAYGSEPKNVALKRLRISQKTNQEYQEFRRVGFFLSI